MINCNHARGLLRCMSLDWSEGATRAPAFAQKIGG